MRSKEVLKLIREGVQLYEDLLDKFDAVNDNKAAFELRSCLDQLEKRGKIISLHGLLYRPVRNDEPFAEFSNN